MAIQVLSSGIEARKPGFTVRSGQTFYAGRPVNLDPNDSTGQTLMTGDGTTLAIGLALETTAASTIPNVFYDDYNRGALISYVCCLAIDMKKDPFFKELKNSLFNNPLEVGFELRQFAIMSAFLTVSLILSPRLKITTFIPKSSQNFLRCFAICPLPNIVICLFKRLIDAFKFLTSDFLVRVRVFNCLKYINNIPTIHSTTSSLLHPGELETEIFLSLSLSISKNSKPTKGNEINTLFRS